MRAEWRVGTQGWNYAAWAGPFYPSDARPADFLSLYARALSTVEVDSTFYAIPDEKVVKGWAGRVGDNFRFALKMPQEITHERALAGTRDIVGQFCDRVRLLGPKLGPVLIQLGPDFGPEQRPALERFLPQLPADIRFAVEFRRRGWLIRPILELLHQHRVALALVEGRWLPRAKMLRLAEFPTTDFGYVRFMGPDRTITDYSQVQVDRGGELRTWAGALEMFAQRVKVIYVYANNHFEGHSPATVRKVQEILGMQVMELSRLRDQAELF